MVKISWLAPLLFGPLILAACEEKPYKPPMPHTDEAPQSALLTGPRQALDKAKGVEQVIRRQDRRARGTAARAKR